MSTKENKSTELKKHRKIKRKQILIIKKRHKIMPKWFPGSLQLKKN
ncbi:hypothetical protein GCM10025853_08980 [Tetragenococcus halophilus subsp. halophilus DSM 20339]|nr:hypothetical protein GCM10025853_08980 [Tetragenococcus halophilus subsp. halophilus DSM 20339]